MANDMGTLRCLLDCLVPLRMWELRNRPDLAELAKAGVDAIASGGDDLQFGGENRREALSAVVTGVAAMALMRPGGVNIFGGHWCRNHKECLHDPA